MQDKRHHITSPLCINRNDNMFLCLIPIVRRTKILWRSLFQFWISMFGCTDRLNWKNMKIKRRIVTSFLVIAAYDISILFHNKLTSFLSKDPRNGKSCKTTYINHNLFFIIYFDRPCLFYISHSILYKYSLLK